MLPYFMKSYGVEVVALFLTLLIVEFNGVTQIGTEIRNEANHINKDFCRVYGEDVHFSVGQRNVSHYLIMEDKYYYWLNISEKECPLKREGINGEQWMVPGFTYVADQEMCCLLRGIQPEPAHVSLFLNKEMGKPLMKILEEINGQLVEKHFENSPELSCVLYQDICNRHNYKGIIENDNDQSLQLERIIKEHLEMQTPRTVNGFQKFRLQKPIVSFGGRAEYRYFIFSHNVECLDANCEREKDLANCKPPKSQDPSTTPLIQTKVIPKEIETEKSDLDSHFIKDAIITGKVAIFLAIGVAFGFLLVKVYDRWRLWIADNQMPYPLEMEPLNNNHQ